MNVFKSIVFVIYMICKVCVANYCPDENGMKKCCKDHWIVNGTCDVCPAGYYGVNCTSVCPPGFYGIQCLQKCNCSDGFLCSPGTGCRKRSTSYCGSPFKKDNTEVIHSFSTYGSKAVYKCNKGFKQSGTDTTLCLNNGSWEVPAITCIPKDCGSPLKKDNTEVIYSSSTYGSKAVYKCNKGFKQSGTDTIFCLNNGSWEVPAITCIPKDCGPPPNITFAVTQADTTTYGSFARFSCLENFVAIGPDFVTCNSEGLWDKSVFLCLRADGTEQRDKTSNLLVYICIAVVLFFVVVIAIFLFVFRISIRFLKASHKVMAYVSEAPTDEQITDAYNEMDIYNVAEDLPNEEPSMSSSQIV